MSSYEEPEIATENGLERRPAREASAREFLETALPRVQQAVAAQDLEAIIASLMSPASQWSRVEIGAGRFAKIGLPFPEVLGPFAGGVEVLCGTLVLLGLAARLAATSAVHE